jgi:hypothetical protein
VVIGRRLGSIKIAKIGNCDTSLSIYVYLISILFEVITGSFDDVDFICNLKNKNKINS